MSDEEVASPRGAAADTEPEDVSGEELEGATKIRFRTKSTWKQINHFTVDGKSETDISNLIFESAKEHLQPWLPPLMDEYKKLDSDLNLWKRKESYQKAKVVSVIAYRCPLSFSCGCNSMLRVLRNEVSVTIEIKNLFSSSSYFYSLLDVKQFFFQAVLIRWSTASIQSFVFLKEALWMTTMLQQ